MRELMAVTKALADESRVRILRALQDGELCVCQVIELLELAPSTVSKHLAQLRQAGFLEIRKDGRWIYYRLAGKDSPKAVRRALTLIKDVLAEDVTAREDAARLKRILAVDPEVLCCQQREVPTSQRRRSKGPAFSSSARGTRRGAR